MGSVPDPKCRETVSDWTYRCVGDVYPGDSDPGGNDCSPVAERHSSDVTGAGRRGDEGVVS